MKPTTDTEILANALYGYCADRKRIINEDIIRIESHFPEDEARLHRVLARKQTLAVLCNVESIIDEFVNGNRNFEYLQEKDGSRQRKPRYLARYQAEGLVRPAQAQDCE